ncbi:similar to Saccharomyces cerevisiae YOR125C CAT5 Protein required for ubiquinone (Coenzyme Q) biosynthesis [Maudiozyma saulgeensis]|uniref:5-demethoxyubiquinone hydroxylase, mitochondrial n=1 Tax=Maudiozyma saulgeensis TaxID=1789683 RepID=A0A1X7QY52_9SACH|nr:similar to Saccharomyces cerevisiae YOR125C CAT5 Protein required for ubiquinone (Coenzyme Q) biosynthesis [Kazachstania saulgeensis]
MYKRSALSNVSRAKPFSVLSPLRAKSSPIVEENTTTKSKFEQLSPAQKAYLDRVIRVDQAGELGADYIYRGQIYVLSHKHPHLRPILDHMWKQEVHHRSTFNNLQLKHRTRPSLITPLWKLGATAMGVVPALLSPEAAMACTEAVETVIGNHYNEQLRCLANQFNVSKIDGSKDEPEEIKKLTDTIKEFRDQELEHLDTAIKNDSHMAVPYKLLTEGIKTVCKAAIWTAERV